MKINAIMQECRKLITPSIKMQVDWSVEVANNIYDALEKNGINQKEFAHKMGKTEPEVTRWLAGTHNFTFKTVAKISAALGENVMPKFKSRTKGIEYKRSLWTIYITKLPSIVEEKKLNTFNYGQKREQENSNTYREMHRDKLSMPLS